MKRLISLWHKYFVEPRAYAEEYVITSRNFLNLGFAAIILAIALRSGGLLNYKFIAANIKNGDMHLLKKVKGEYNAIGSRNPRTGIFVPGTQKHLALMSESFITGHFFAHKTARIGPQHLNKPAVAYVYPGSGIVQMYIEGELVLAAEDVRDYWQEDIYQFIALFLFAFAMFFIAILRQIILVGNRVSSGKPD